MHAVPGAIASLPWYDLREVRQHTDRLWARLAEAFRDRGITGVPDRLDRHTHWDVQWRSPRFLFGQCCGYDVVVTHADRLAPILAPTYTGSRAGPGRYRSLVLVRSGSPVRSFEDLRGRRCVVNSASSHSGMNVLRSMVAPLHENGRFFRSVTISGSHAMSLAALRSGAADVAAVDSVSHALFELYRPSAVAGLRVLCETPSAPAPPFVTSVDTPRDWIYRMRAAIEETLADPQLAPVRQALMLEGAVTLEPGAYLPILESERAARANGYCILEEDVA